jgi:hypothetical protein
LARRIGIAIVDCGRTLRRIRAGSSAVTFRRRGTSFLVR